MKDLKTILIDDNPSNNEALLARLKSVAPTVKVVATCTSGAEGIETINNLQPDLVFLDIEMPMMNGFLMLQQLQFKNFDLIFVTAYDHYAIKAIRYSAIDYLVKPVETEELVAAIERVLGKKGKKPGSNQFNLLMENLLVDKPTFQRIAIPTLDGLFFIQVEDIIYLEASSNYTHFHLYKQDKLITSKTMKDFEELLPGSRFFRIHHSYLINLAYVSKYIRGDGGQVIMSNGHTLDVSKRRKPEFLKLVNG